MSDPEDMERKDEWVGRAAPPCAMVIFGATGDLTRRKLIPAIYNLINSGVLPDGFAVVGVGRSPLSDDEFRRRMEEDLRKFATVEVDGEKLEWLLRRLRYVSGDLGDAETFNRLKAALEKVDEELGTEGSYLFYLAVPPGFFDDFVLKLGESGLMKEEEGRWRRVIVEKPFGHDLESARALNHTLREVLRERQIYRIDHYLGKETVQNIMAFRFANGIFEPVWNRRYIDHVQITVAEAVGVEGRGGYYETAGVLRDMIQNHVFQVLSLVAMEPPAHLGSEAVRDEKIKVMTAARAFTPARIDAECVRGQYGAGSIAGKPVPGYRQEDGVAPDSTTETFAMLTMYFDNWRWAGVPFYIRSAKRMPKRVTEIAIQFRAAPHPLFGTEVMEQVGPNQLVIRIQPDEGITLRFAVKVPGQITLLRDVNMDFRYGSSFGVQLAEAYERLLLDCILG
ncbi:MAG TPA: glucose-6-phosphate dehydrogenase, partial [Thermoanaerobaculia bacterium]